MSAETILFYKIDSRKRTLRSDSSTSRGSVSTEIQSVTKLVTVPATCLLLTSLLT
jgi:hypothetical protein